MTKKLRTDIFNNFLALQFPIIIGAVVLFVLIPIVLILITPILLYRYFVKLSSKWLRPDLGELVTSLGTIFAADALHPKPECSIVIKLVLEGKLELDSLIELTTRQLLNARLPNGEIQYPELKQELVQWFGYYFWKNDGRFHINNHVSLQNQDEDEVFSDVEIKNLLDDLVQRPWATGRALWEIVLVHNCKLRGSEGEKSILFLRIHHALADGHSYMSLITEGLGEKPNPHYAQPKYHERRILDRISFGLVFPFRCAYELSESYVEYLIPWVQLPFFPSQKNEEFFLETTEEISMRKIKSIKNHFGVTFVSVLSAASTGALRQIMIKKKMDISSIFKIMTPMPVPGHPPQLRNHFANAMKKLPVGEEDPIKRLIYCGEDEKRQKASALLVFTQYFVPAVGCLLSFFVKFIVDTSSFRPIITLISLGNDYIFINGHKCVEVTPSMGNPAGKLGLMIGGGGYVDSIRISVAANATVMNNHDVIEMTDLIVKEIDILYNQINN